MSASISLSDKRYFNLRVGKRILAEQLFKSKGTIPVYSGSVVTVRGYVAKSKLTDFNHDHIIWGIDDAVFDFGLIPKGTPFDITDHCGCIEILDNTIYPEFVCHQLQSRRKEIAYDWTIRASMGRMKKVDIHIPTKSDGAFDLEKQKTLASRHREIKQITQRLGKLEEELRSMNFSVDTESQNFIGMPVSQVFDLSVTTNHSEFTKSFVNDHKGSIPVFSASKDENAVEYGYIKDNLENVKYFENCLTWNIDGSVGKAFYRKGRFTLSEKVIPLIFRHEYDGKILPEYAKIVIEQSALESGFHYSNKAGKEKIADMLLQVPVTGTPSDQTIDISLQSQIVERHRRAEEVKNALLQYIEELTDPNASVSIESWPSY